MIVVPAKAGNHQQNGHNATKMNGSPPSRGRQTKSDDTSALVRDRSFNRTQ